MLPKEIKVALIGLDTSHSIEFAKRMQAPECPAAEKVEGLRAVSCLRFDTPFQSKEGLDARQKTLEGWGVKVTLSFEEAVADCDAVLLEINDPSFHLDYFKKAASLGKRIFVDKPLADTAAHANEMRSIAKANGLEVMSCSPLRYVGGLDEAMAKIPAPDHSTFFGPLGKAPAGSSIVWYGVHTVEMMVKAMGLGAKSVRTVANGDSIFLLVEYADGRRATAELVDGAYCYGGSLRCKHEASAFSAPASYPALLRNVESFLRSGRTDATLDIACEVTAVIHAGERSYQSGKEEILER